MTFWDNLGASVGIGACVLQVSVDTPEVGWSEHAAGSASLRGGRVSQEITTLKAALVEHWVTVLMVGKVATVQHHFQTHDEAVLATGLTVVPAEERRWTFNLTAPARGDFARDWFVGVRATIPGAVDRGARADFKLVPPAVYRHVAGILTEVSRLAPGAWTLHGQTVRAEFPATGAVHAILDGVRLDLAQDGDYLRGQVVVNPQEHSAGDVLKSLVHADRRATPVHISMAEPETARPAFEAALRPNLDSLRQLPIASEHPAQSQAELPRPVAAPEPPSA